MQVKITLASISHQFRLSEMALHRIVQQTRRLLLSLAAGLPWLEHLTSKTVALHWKNIKNMDTIKRSAKR